MKVFQWLGREFVGLSGEGKAGATAKEETRDLLLRFDEALRDMGLSLDHTVRTRLWARDRPSRDLGSEARLDILSGRARSASSSYIAPSHFDSQARVALDLLALRPSRPGLAKTIVEYDPPIVPVRSITYDSVVFLSGVTAVLPTLADQVADIIPRIQGSLADAGTSWERAVQVSCFLHHAEKLETLKELVRETVGVEIARMEYAFVDGYSAEGKLIEIEVTAIR